MPKSVQSTTAIKIGKPARKARGTTERLVESTPAANTSLSPQSSEERINIRVAAAHKITIEMAAGLKGLSLTDYVRSTMIEQARLDIQRVKEITLTEKDVHMVLNASLSTPLPSERLLEASERYLKLVSDQS